LETAVRRTAPDVPVQSKFTAFWLETVNSCGRNSRALWRTVNTLFQAPRERTSEKLSADQFAQYFMGKVDGTPAITALADPPVLVGTATSFSQTGDKPATVSVTSAYTWTANCQRSNTFPKCLRRAFITYVVFARSVGALAAKWRLVSSWHW